MKAIAAVWTMSAIDVVRILEKDNARLRTLNAELVVALETLLNDNFAQSQARTAIAKAKGET